MTVSSRNKKEVVPRRSQAPALTSAPSVSARIPLLVLGPQKEQYQIETSSIKFRLWGESLNVMMSAPRPCPVGVGARFPPGRVNAGPSQGPL